MAGWSSEAHHCQDRAFFLCAADHCDICTALFCLVLCARTQNFAEPNSHEPDFEKITLTDDVIMVTQDGYEYQLITQADSIATLHGRRVACNLQSCDRVASCARTLFAFCVAR